MITMQPFCSAEMLLHAEMPDGLLALAICVLPAHSIGIWHDDEASASWQ